MDNIKKPPMINPFPVTQQDYRHYLPSAYDPSMNIYETLVNMREYLNQLIASQNELIQQWVDLQEWINQTLETYTREQIEKMLSDGTFDKIINDTLFKELEERMNNNITQAVKEMNDKVNSIVSASPVDVVETVTELNTKYPNGRTGIVVVKSDGFYYYWQNNKWNKGALYLNPVTYGLVDKNGLAYNLNRDEKWKENADIVTLKSGYYTAYIQTEGAPNPNPDPDDPTKPDPNQPPYPNPDFPIAKNFPESLKGVMCLIEVIDLGSEGRVYYKVSGNWGNQSWEATKRVDGSMSEWKYILASSEGTPRQLKRLTYANGTSMAFRFGTNDQRQWEQDKIDGDLVVPIQSLDTGEYVATISKRLPYGEIKEDRGLPPNFPGGQVCHVSVRKNVSGRKEIKLSTLYTGAVWFCTTGVNGERPVWSRIDVDDDRVNLDKLQFASKINKIENDNMRIFTMADSHGQEGALETQTAYVNNLHFNNFNDLGNYIHDIDYRIHLGDWMNGDYPTERSIASIVKYTSQFYSKPNSYGVIGNHDYNGVWGTMRQPVLMHKDGYIDAKTLQKYVVKQTGINTDKCWYKVDDEKRKVRLLFIHTFDVPFTTDSEGKLMTDPQNQNAYGKEQVEWFINQLKTVPQDYNVMIFGHHTFDNVFSDDVSYNGDTMRKIAEGYQAKKKDTYATTDIEQGKPDFDYYYVDGEFDFTTANGKILFVMCGHRHRDITKFQGGIRYICNLCSKADKPTGSTEPRDYYDVTSDSLDYFEIDMINEKILNYRYGYGKDREFNMFKL